MAVLLALGLGIAPMPDTARAQDDADAADGKKKEIETVTAVADPVGLLEDQATDSLFGVSRSVLETPRSFSIVSDTTIERYGIEDIDDFITTTPSTFGGSFFGIPGAVSVRGSIGDNYFRGFRRAVNNGFLPTPVGASSHVEIVRGPPPAIYGAARIGGFMNFYPKTAKAAGLTAADGPSGSVSFTGGSYSKKNGAVELNLPFLLAGRETAVSVYAEIEDSKSFYRNRKPEHQLVQMAFNHDVSENFRVEFGGQYYHSEGYYQTPGWNRVTQQLIDDGTYITGRDTDMTDLDGNGRLTPNEVDAAVGTFFGTSNIRTLIDFGFFGVAPAYGLDEGVGTTRLDRRTVLLTPDHEMQNADSFVIYFDGEYEFNDGSVAKLQFFYDDLEARIGQSTGFAAEHDVEVFEVRGSYQFNVSMGNAGEIDIYTQVDHRIYDSELRENFLSGYLVIDRQDLSFGARGSDIFDTPFTVEPGGIGIAWDSNYDSKWDETGVALVADIQFAGGLSILLNGRYDYYTAQSIDTGATVFNPALANTLYKTHDNDFTWSASISYDTGFGVIPYFTYADSSSLLQNSNGGVNPGTVASGDLLADSELFEGGLKFSLIDDTLVGSFAYYWQRRSVIDAVGNVSTETGEGFEAELRYLITNNWVVTGALTVQDYKIGPVGPCLFGGGRGEFVVIPPSVVGLTGEQGYGGIFAALNASCLSELQDGYPRNTIPETVGSLFVTYTSDEFSWGQFGATFGGTYVSKTGGKINNAIVLPDYVLFRLSLFAEFKSFSIIATIDNLFDEKYFQPLQGVYEEVAVIPGRGREFRITGKFSF